LPFSFYIALVLTAARLYADQEMSVLVTSGRSPSQVLMWTFVSAIVVASAVVYLSVDVTPRALGDLERFLSAERIEREFETMTPGVFHSFNDGARVTYSESASPDKRELSRVFIAAQVQGHSVTIWAQRGSQYIDAVTGSRFMRLGAGRRYEGEIGQTPYRVVKFETLSQRIDSAIRRWRTSRSTRSRRAC
jgi:lipopolysaccharide export system permease protein